MLFTKTFRGGIHPDDRKTQSMNSAIRELPASKIMVFPLLQHLGAPSEPIVSVGDYVKSGQLIAKASGFVSANIHSSISGTVVSIEPRIHPSGNSVNSIIIENDDKYLMDENIKPYKPLGELSREEIIKIVQDAGIVGMGGAAFPTHIKLSPPPDKKVDTVIINGSECEPYLTSDYRAMVEYPEIILFGCTAIMKALGVEKAFVAVENNKPEAVIALQNKLGEFKNIEVVTVKTKYPQGSEKQLIKAVTGRGVPSGKLPADIGVVVLNIDTANAIANAINTGEPLTTRVVTVAGDCIKNPSNFKVKIGTSAKDILDATGEFTQSPAKIIFGGPMMGISIFSTDTPIIKATGAILALSEKEVDTGVSSYCLRCGKCVEACPMNLQPITLKLFAQKEDIEELKRLNIMDCMECGACSYLCPGRQDPVQYVRLAKPKVIASLKGDKK